ncbi:HDOD domain-containing protein [Pelagibius sp.]|uniref:HDOD domain-containing protein n=1 Tax=Pelagibius sp. TaxID=1931238 RepID=UPI00261F3CBD|nr:HDOD domain-containing protein [Pelagibius sp.]
MKPRLLFVDDEKNILQGLRRLLRSMRNDWDMDFAEGGEMALSMLAEQAADVVVTDMKMPGMNGAELLDQVATLYPGSLRLILSGEADTEATFRTVKTSHQFLPKPSNSERLIETVKAGLALREPLTDATQQTWVTSIACLAATRASFEELGTLIESASAPMERVGDLFAGEPGLAAKVMQLANSAYFGIGDPVCSPKDAVNLLGWEVLRRLLQDHDLTCVYAEGPCRDFYEQAIDKAREVSELAGWIAEQRQASDSAIAEARLAGLLHNLGRLLLCYQAPGDYAKVLERASGGQALDAAEIDQFGQPHAVFGAYLAQIWGLPANVVGAIGHLQHPGEAQLPEDGQTALLASHSALAIVAGLQAEDPKAATADALDRTYLERQNCAGEIDGWVDRWRDKEAAA